VVRSGGHGIMEAFAARKTTREIAPTALPVQILSNLLWAACGHNRPGGPFSAPGRTAGSAGNSQEIEVVLLTGRAGYAYYAPDHQLDVLAEGDFRGLGLTIGQRGAEGFAPIQVVLIADPIRLSHASTVRDPGLHDSEVKNAYVHFDAGLIAQNVYLFAAAHGLAAWLHNCDRDGLHKALRLGEGKRVLYAISVGLPARPSGVSTGV